MFLAKNYIYRKMGLSALPSNFSGNCVFKEAHHKLLFLNTGGCEGFLFKNPVVLILLLSECLSGGVLAEMSASLAFRLVLPRLPCECAG